MNTHILRLLALLALALSGLSLSAQPAPAGPAEKNLEPRLGDPIKAHMAATRAARRAEFIADAGLTPEQAAKLDAVNDDLMAKVQAVQADDSLTPQQKNAKQRELAKAAMAAREAIVTPEQRAKAKAASEARVGAAREKQRTEFIAEVGVTDEQAAKLDAVDSALKAKMDAVRDDDSLTPRQKGEKMMELSKQASSDRYAILTPEQQAKAKARLERLRKESMHGHSHPLAPKAPAPTEQAK